MPGERIRFSPQTASPAARRTPTKSAKPSPSARSSRSSPNRRRHPTPEEFEETIARISFSLRAEHAQLRQTHTQDLRILREQQVALRERGEALEAQPGAGSGPAAVGLDADLARTASEAAELQLALLLKQNTTLQAEA